MNFLFISIMCGFSFDAFVDNRFGKSMTLILFSRNGEDNNHLIYLVSFRILLFCVCFVKTLLFYLRTSQKENENFK